jgi:hypothetical protein
MAEKISAYAIATGHPAPQVVSVDIDNSRGKHGIGLYTVKVVNTDRSQVSLKLAFEAVGDWGPQDITYGDEKATRLSNRGTDLYNQLINLDQVLPGASSTEYLVVPNASAAPPLEVFVLPDDGQTLRAAKVS